mmetsp:Transcript_16359/g.15695  ORF Transcript_16359/g.15695 Transcript_16359/m.15695 type:complete len:114 (-) Transcript_16359:9-350(-)
MRTMNNSNGRVSRNVMNRNQSQLMGTNFPKHKAQQKSFDANSNINSQQFIKTITTTLGGPGNQGKTSGQSETMLLDLSKIQGKVRHQHSKTLYMQNQFKGVPVKSSRENNSSK